MTSKFSQSRKTQHRKQGWESKDLGYSDMCFWSLAINVLQRNAANSSAFTCHRRPCQLDDFT